MQTSHVSTTGFQRSKDGQYPGNGGISGQAPRRRPNVHQIKPRPLIPAAPMPNASVIENQQPRHNRRMSVNNVSTGRRATSRTYHSSFPYPMGGRSSNYRPGHLLPATSRSLHVDQQYPRHEYVSASSRAKGLPQSNSHAGINLPTVNRSFNVNFSHRTEERVPSNADLQLHVPSQNSGDVLHSQTIEGLDPLSMGPPQSYWPAHMIRNPISSSMEPPAMPVPGTHSYQPQPASTQFGMNLASDIGSGELYSQPGSSVAPARYQPETYSSFVQSQSTTGHISTRWQLQSHPQFPTPIRTLPQASTSQMDSRNRLPYVSSQPQYFTPPFQQKAFYPGFPGQINRPTYFPSHCPAPENNDQMFEHPAQLLSEESQSVGSFIVDVMDSFDRVV